MSACQSCGGIIGRDCWNPQECAEITARIEVDQQRPAPEITENARLRDALVQADLTIRSFPGADQSHVEFIRAALRTQAPAREGGELRAALWAMVEHFERVDGDAAHKAVIAQATAALSRQHQEGEGR